MRKEVSNNRLEYLAAFLDTLPRKEFDYAVWSETKGKPLRQHCGTTACALGWATVLPKFRKLGLYLDTGGTPFIKDTLKEGTFAASDIFGIHEEEASALFTGGLLADAEGRLLLSPIESYDMEKATPKQIAKRIRKFIKNRHKL